MAICPKCESAVSEVSIEPIRVRGRGSSWHGVAYSCSSCGSVLSVAIDPVALKSDIVSEIVDELRTD